ncbi:MAG: long-chain fatty acid--CoA ligase [Acidocella sp.]|nr:long-chain fatty acid--CoA ligase [Acidocella sp.]
MDGISQRSAAAEFQFTPMPAYEMLDHAVQRFGSRPAIDFLGRRYNWADIGGLANRAAAGLQKIGVGPGVKVGLCLPNTPYFVVMYFAILKAGGTVVNFNPLYTEREIENQARDAGVEIIVSLDLTLIQDKIGRLAASGLFKRVIMCSMVGALPPLKGLLFRLIKGGQLARIPSHAPYMRYEALLAVAAQPAPVVIDPLNDIATLQFTGGTTGFPKAAMLTHANITTNVQQILASGPDLVLGQERILGVLPLFHVFAMTGVMNLGVTIGAELLLMPRLDMKQLMQVIRRRRPTVMPGVPTLYTAITNAAQGKNGAPDQDLSFIKFCISGGAPIAIEAADRFERISRCSVLEGYGLSETSPVVTATPVGGVRRGSVGIALPGTVVEIRDPEHPTSIMPQGERGEICVRGPQVMKGYYNRPADTDAVFIDGALRTGDIGYLDADGYLFIVDRIKDLILCGGYNVYPRVIEEAAYQHPAVQDAIAIGVPDAYRGQAPKLFVTLQPDASATAAEIKEFLVQHLNKIEQPREVEIRATLPRTMVGKLSKKELVAEEMAKALEKSSIR